MQDKTVVSLFQCEDYTPLKVKETLLKLFEPFNGVERFIKRNDLILIKPNLLKPALPEQAVTTHPLLIQALLELCLDHGGRPCIGDSPGFFSIERVSQTTGLKQIAEKLGVPIREFNNPVPVKSIHKGNTLKEFKLDRLILDADCILNVPKLKAHQQLVITGAIKNLYGCIPGKRKAKYHYKFGDLENLFAEMLVENYQLVKPAFNIMDAITIMEGNGPARGQPRFLGLLGGAQDGIALDRIFCEILGIPEHEVRTLRAARKMGVGTWDINQIEAIGADLEKVKMKDFLKAAPMPIKFQFTRVVRSIIRNLYYRWIKEKRNAEVTILQ